MNNKQIHMQILRIYTVIEHRITSIKGSHAIFGFSDMTSQATRLVNLLKDDPVSSDL